ncbi:MAG: hypothetical protein SWJ54_17760 [Cyanobacteriota bacterium]|nr:hypothetical protein [Cyanobacteriota bacterium]
MMILALLLRGYAIIGVLFFSHGLLKFLADKSTPNSHTSSWIVLGIATVFWPVVLPLSHLERQANRKVNSEFEEVELRMTAPPLVERDRSESNQSNLKLGSSSEHLCEKQTFRESNIA